MKCKKKTADVGPKVVQKGSRSMVQSRCACGCKKCRFVSKGAKAKSGGFLGVW